MSTRARSHRLSMQASTPHASTSSASSSSTSTSTNTSSSSSSNASSERPTAPASHLPPNFSAPAAAADASTKIHLLRAYLIKALESPWTDAPPAKAPSHFPTELQLKHRELIHDCAAQTIRNTTANILDEFDLICSEHSLEQRLQLLDRLIVDSVKTTSNHTAPGETVKEALLAAKQAELARLQKLLASSKELERAAEANLQDLKSRAQALGAAITDTAAEVKVTGKEVDSAAQIVANPSRQ